MVLWSFLAGLEINTEGLRRLADHIQRLAAAAEAARSARAAGSLGNTRTRSAVTIIRTGNRELLNLRGAEGRAADPELHHHQDRRHQAGQDERNNNGDDGHTLLGGGRKHQEANNRIQAVDDNDGGSREIVVAKIIGPRRNTDYGIERVHSTWADQNK